MCYDDDNNNNNNMSKFITIIFITLYLIIIDQNKYNK